MSNIQTVRVKGTMNIIEVMDNNKSVLDLYLDGCRLPATLTVTDDAVLLNLDMEFVYVTGCALSMAKGVYLITLNNNALMYQHTWLVTIQSKKLEVLWCGMAHSRVTYHAEAGMLMASIGQSKVQLCALSGPRSPIGAERVYEYVTQLAPVSPMQAFRDDMQSTVGDMGSHGPFNMPQPPVTGNLQTPQANQPLPFKCTPKEFLELSKSGSTLQVRCLDDSVVSAELIYSTMSELAAFTTALVTVLEQYSAGTE